MLREIPAGHLQHSSPVQSMPKDTDPRLSTEEMGATPVSRKLLLGLQQKLSLLYAIQTGINQRYRKGLGCDGQTEQLPLPNNPFSTHKGLPGIVAHELLCNREQNPFFNFGPMSMRYCCIWLLQNKNYIIPFLI